LHYKFIHRENDGGLLHWLKYVYRSYIEDVDDWFRETEETWTEYRLYWFEWHMANWGRRICAYGHLSSCHRGKLIDLELVKERVKNERSSTRTLYHPRTKKQLYRDPGIECWFPTEADRPKDFCLARRKMIRYLTAWSDRPSPDEQDFWFIYRLAPQPCMIHDLDQWEIEKGLSRRSADSWSKRLSPMQEYQLAMSSAMRRGEVY
jgi:hypothetical protein